MPLPSPIPNHIDPSGSDDLPEVPPNAFPLPGKLGQTTGSEYMQALKKWAQENGLSRKPRVRVYRDGPFATVVRQELERRGWSYSKAAKEAGIGWQAVRRWWQKEGGLRTESLEALAGVLGLALVKDPAAEA